MSAQKGVMLTIIDYTKFNEIKLKCTYGTE